MNYSPHTHLALARARHEDMLKQAEHARLARSFEDERPSAFSRLRAHLTRKHETEPRPVVA
jgi:hypothetical protein